MRIVITGASGFLGGHFARQLARTGAEIVAVSRRPAQLPAEVRQVVVADYSSTPPGDVLVHLAETGSIAEAERAPANASREAIDRLRMLLAGRSGIVVYGSSAAVYGDETSRPHVVGGPVAARGRYAQSKLECEKLVTDAGGLVLRLANAYGPQMRADNVLAKLLGQVNGTGPVEVWDETPVRDFVWIDDVVQCLSMLLRAAARGVYNVGTGRGTSVRELGETLLELAGQSDRALISTQPSGRKSHLVVDIEATTAACGWRPQTELKEGLRRMLEQVR